MSETIQKPDANTRLVIDPVTRAIAPKYRRQKAVYVAKGDHNSVLIAFEMPRYVDGYDMSAEENSIQIHYANISSEDTTKYSKGFSGAEYVTVEEDEETGEEIVSFCWRLPGTATKYAGIVSVGITVEQHAMVDDEMQEIYSWSTAPYGETIVWDSMDNTAETLEKEYSYLVTACNFLVTSMINEAIDSGTLDGVSVTHSWDGTVLNVTSKSGTSSADLKGAKGDRGLTGKSGVHIGNTEPTDPDINVWVNTEGGASGTDAGAILKIKDIYGNWVESPAITGSSAYEIAVKNGFKGTEAEWLKSLSGDGKDGKSAYEVAVKNGFEGTEAEWLKSLNGDGKDGDDGFSPTVSIEPINNGHRVTITDANGKKSFEVLNGYATNESVDISEGWGENSLVMCDLDDNEAISDYSVTMGRNVAAGRRAFYIKSIDTAECKIYLSKNQVTPVFSTADNTDTSFETPNYSVGDEFSIINGSSHYILCGAISAVQNNVVDYSLRVYLDGSETYSDEGIVEGNPWLNRMDTSKIPADADAGWFSAYELAELSNATLSVQEIGNGYVKWVSLVHYPKYQKIFEQYPNKYYLSVKRYLPFDKFVANTDKDNYTFCVPHKPEEGSVTLGVNAIATGFENISAGDYGFVSGRGNIVAGNYGTATGRRNRVGYASFVSGFENIIKGNGSFGAGYSNLSTGINQFVFGSWSKDEPDKIFVIGNGTGESNRKNIMTLDRNGNLFLAGSLKTANDVDKDSYLYTFDNYRSVENFVSESRNLTLSCHERSMKAVSTGADPIIFRKFSIPLDGTKYPYIKIRYKAPSNLADARAKIYFTTTKYTSVSEERRIEFTLTKNDAWNDIIVDMSANSYWSDDITMLRLDIPNSSASGITMYFKYIGLFHDIEEAETFSLAEGSMTNDAISLIDLQNNGKLITSDGEIKEITANTIRGPYDITLNLTGRVCVVLYMSADEYESSATFSVDGTQYTVPQTDEGRIIIFEGYVANTITAHSTFGYFKFYTLRYV